MLKSVAELLSELGTAQTAMWVSTTRGLPPLLHLLKESAREDVLACHRARRRRTRRSVMLLQCQQMPRPKQAVTASNSLAGFGTVG